MEYEVGEFSKMTRIPLKTLRYFKEEGFLVPTADSDQRFFYDERQVSLARQIVMMEEMGIPPGDIRRVMDGMDMGAVVDKRKKKLLQEAEAIKSKIDEIDGMMESYSGQDQSEPELRHVPGCIICYTRKHLKSPIEIRDTILDFYSKCEALNPDIRRVDPAYEFLVNMNKEFNVWDMDFVFAVAVESVGKESADIKFTTTNDCAMVCVTYKGPYARIGDAYASAVKWMIDKGYSNAGHIRDCFLKGSWNHNTSAYVELEIQIPVKHL